jgi:small subunit ribosomal protein S7
MPRKGYVPRREVLPDPVFGSSLVTKFINCLMYDGKKSTAEGIFYGALKIVEQKAGGEEALKVFKKAVENTKPILEVKTRRVGGANYQVPVEVNPNRRISLSIRWLITYSRSRPGKTMVEKLAGEILDAANNRGSAIKKREEVHKMAEANKAFAHYRW